MPKKCIAKKRSILRTQSWTNRNHFLFTHFVGYCFFQFTFTPLPVSPTYCPAWLPLYFICKSNTDFMLCKWIEEEEIGVKTDVISYQTNASRMEAFTLGAPSSHSHKFPPSSPFYQFNFYHHRNRLPGIVGSDQVVVFLSARWWLRQRLNWRCCWVSVWEKSRQSTCWSTMS